MLPSKYAFEDKLCPNIPAISTSKIIPLMQLIMFMNCNNVKYPNRIYSHKMETPYLFENTLDYTYVCE